MPFITEELWHELEERTTEDCVIVAKWPVAEKVDTQLLEDFDIAREVIGGVRNIRNTKQLGHKDALELKVKSSNQAIYAQFSAPIKKLANLSSIEFVTEKVDGATSFVIKGDELFVPLAGLVDETENREEVEAELNRMKGFLLGITKKLSNERFVAGAPAEVVANEKKKQADAEAKIKALEESLASM